MKNDSSFLYVTGITILFILMLLAVPSTADHEENYCETGHTYDEFYIDPVYSISGSWYLGVNSPLSCSGNLSVITLKFYEPLFTGNYCVYWALWEPNVTNSSTSDSYKRVINGNNFDTERFCLYFSSGNNDPSLINIQLSNLEPYPVKKGSIVGVYFRVSLLRPPLLVIGRARSASTPNQGVCRIITSGFSQNSQDLTCEPSHMIVDQIINLEAEIDTIDCGTLQPPSNGHFLTPLTDTQYSAIVHYGCSQGYTLTGPSNRTCLSTGSWSDSNPYCISNSCTVNCQCTDPGVPDNGVRTGEDFSIGSSVRFTCNKGYKLIKGTSTIMCIASDVWNSTIPKCVSNISSNISIHISVHHSVDTAVGSSHQAHSITEIHATTSQEYHATINRNLPSTTISALTSSSTHTMHINSTKTTLYTSTHTNSATLQQTITTTTTTVQGAYTSTAVELHGTSTTIQIPVRTVILSPRGRGDRILSGKMFTIVLVASVGMLLLCGLCTILGMTALIIRLCKKRKRGEGSYHSKTTIESLDNPIFYSVYDTNMISSKISTDQPPMYEMLYHNNSSTQSHTYAELSPYEAPARGKHDLYVQLDRIKVKRLLSKDIKIQELLGQGQFGSVHKALCNNSQVAVKRLIEEANDISRIKFLQEAAIMGQFCHPNVVCLHGVVTDGDNIMLVVELMSKGDLYKYLKEKRNNNQVKSTLAKVLLSYCQQIAGGMDYLSKRCYVHRDLAARNILLSDNNQCKIADFGMSRDVEQEGYYVAQRGTKIPVKWTAPEALKYRKYSTASDVWSYGCVLYEIWSLGCKPFENCDNQNVLSKVEKGFRLSPPPGISYVMYKLMIMCWHPDYKQRPTFNDILLYLTDQDQNYLLTIPNEDRSSHPLAGTLGAPLEGGQKMYKELQNTYMYYFTLENSA